MDWIDLAPFLVILGGQGAMWWRLNGRIDTLDAKFERKFDQIMTALLTMSRDLGELKGQAHTHH